MRLFLLSISLMCSLLAWSPVQAATLLVLGDSLSAGYGLDVGEGWVNLMQKRLERQGYGVEVVNASISGDTSAGGLARVDDLLKRHRPQWLLLELGANDGLRGLSPQAMRRNLSTIVMRAKAAGSKVLLIGMQMPPNYGKRYTAMFEQVYRDVAADQQVPLVPFLMERVALDPQLMQADNHHPNAAAQPALLDTVWPYLEPMLPRPDKG